MKSFIKILTVTAFLFASTSLLQAQTPPHPNNGGTEPGTSTNTPVGGGAPIGSGTLLLIGLAGIYGAFKAYPMRKRLEE